MLRPAPRRGVTLVELVVALAVLATAALLVPAVRPQALAASAGRTLTEVVATARRTAVERGTTVRLTVDTSGVWRIVATRGDTTATGQLPRAAAPGRTVALVVDMLGGCRPDASVAAAVPAEPLDAHRCLAGGLASGVASDAAGGDR